MVAHLAVGVSELIHHIPPFGQGLGLGVEPAGSRGRADHAVEGADAELERGGHDVDRPVRTRPRAAVPRTAPAALRDERHVAANAEPQLRLLCALLRVLACVVARGQQVARRRDCVGVGVDVHLDVAPDGEHLVRAFELPPPQGRVVDEEREQPAMQHRLSLLLRRRALLVAQRQQAVEGALARLEDGGLDGEPDLLERGQELGRKRGARRMPVARRLECLVEVEELRGNVRGDREREDYDLGRPEPRVRVVEEGSRFGLLLGRRRAIAARHHLALLRLQHLLPRTLLVAVAELLGGQPAAVADAQGRSGAAARLAIRAVVQLVLAARPVRAARARVTQRALVAVRLLAALPAAVRAARARVTQR